MSSKRCSGNGNKMHITQLSSRAHNNEDLTMQRSADSGVWPKMWNWKLKHIRVERRVLGEWMVSFIGEDLPWECSALIEMENGLYITLEVEIFIWYCRLKSAIWHWKAVSTVKALCFRLLGNTSQEKKFSFGQCPKGGGGPFGPFPPCNCPIMIYLDTNIVSHDTFW